MNPLGLIGVIILALVLNIPWALYYLAIQFLFYLAAEAECEIFFAIGCMIAPIRLELPWWYDLLLIQHLLVACTFSIANRLVKEDKIDEPTADVSKRLAYNISTALLLISDIGCLYWFFTQK